MTVEAGLDQRVSTMHLAVSKQTVFQASSFAFQTVLIQHTTANTVPISEVL
jgi:hypothetical protein